MLRGPACTCISGEGKRRVPWIALVFVSIAAQLAWMDATVGTYDEGLVLVGADRVLRGDMPYRDFWTLYGPGSYYLLAGLFRLFGEFALVERGFDIAAKTAIAALVVALVLQFGRRTVALAAGVLSLGLLLYLRSYSAPLFPAMAASARHCLGPPPRLDRCAADAGTPGGRRPRVHDLLPSRPGRLHPGRRRGVHDPARMGRIDRSAPRPRARHGRLGRRRVRHQPRSGRGLLRLQRTGRRALSRFRGYAVFASTRKYGPCRFRRSWTCSRAQCRHARPASSAR